MKTKTWIGKHSSGPEERDTALAIAGNYLDEEIFQDISDARNAAAVLQTDKLLVLDGEKTKIEDYEEARS